ncbi:MAG: hypothetical protein DME99_00770 [Verrucomicrobia bacterium]|nr:MAG: hypothetical protein DME99_00770 [Verrucomicrobiota bacterium]
MLRLVATNRRARVEALVRKGLRQFHAREGLAYRGHTSHTGERPYVFRLCRWRDLTVSLRFFRSH